MTELYANVQLFSSEVYGQVVGQQEGNLQNVLISPLSIYVALLMTATGAAGRTLDELRSVLHIPEQLQAGEVHDIGSKLSGEFVSNKHVEILLANKIFITRGINLKSEFESALRTYYSAGAEKVTRMKLANLEDNEAKRRQINQWVSEQTKSKIQELIPVVSCSVDQYPSTAKGAWDSTFKESETKPAAFYDLDGSETQVKTMNKIGSFKYVVLSDLGVKAIKIPFEDTEYELLIILPDANDGLTKWLQQLKSEDALKTVLQGPFEDEYLTLYLPRFKLDGIPPMNLKAHLSSLGLQSLFSRDADLSLITEGSKLYVDKLLHKTFISVNEGGVEAAAASGIEFTFLSGRPSTEFKVDHPFFFGLIYKTTVPVFLGKIIWGEN
ncbi:serine proteinase inhibitor [Opisthorchis viverrini]|uniref:Serine proteinase inhibitor n=1 Tax=Opisthorchis viverrini TaxID=6198 RepID=A0A1S8X1H8_OPIVI|nr:serine proteinase inhibitor [Opisthorchis viverrini]